MTPAVTAYLAREKEANEKPEGADHKAILADVAQEHGVCATDLRSAVLDATNHLGSG